MKSKISTHRDYQKYKIIEKFVCIIEFIKHYLPTPETPSAEKTYYQTKSSCGCGCAAVAVVVAAEIKVKGLCEKIIESQNL